MPPEVIFILILIIFSILESALRGKKGSRRDEMPGPGRTAGWPTGEDDPPRRVEERGPDRVVVAERPEAPRETADQMVPDDIWEEIAALARGDVEETLRRRRERARGGAAPDPDRRTPVPTPRHSQKRAPAPPPIELPPPVPARIQPPDDEHPEGGDSRGEVDIPPEAEVRPVAWGERRPIRDEGQRKPWREERSAPAPVAWSSPIRQGEIAGARRETPEERALRRERLHHRFRGFHALRHAVIAREVLGRPLALRDYGDDELWSQ